MTNLSYDPRDPRVAFTDIRALWVLVGMFAAIEGVLQLADLGLAPRLREEVWYYGAFWSVLLNDVEPVFRVQPVTMFVSHAFLHGGLIHLAFNGTILLAIGRIVVLEAGQARALLIFFLSAIGGAALFAAMAGPDIVPMIGASGGVFGFFGVWKRWELSNHRAAGISADPVWKFLIAFTAFNAAILLIYPNIAWQAHLGGFITGWLLAPALRRPPRTSIWDS